MDYGYYSISTLNRRYKRPLAAVFSSLPSSPDRIGYAATEELKKRQIKKNRAGRRADNHPATCTGRGRGNRRTEKGIPAECRTGTERRTR